MSARVVALAVAPVKGTRLLAREEISLTADGVRENRRFFLTDADGRMINGKRFGALQAVVADYDHAQRTLSLRLPDGTQVDGPVVSGPRVAARFFSSTIATSEVRGPWAEALSDFLGRPVRLVEPVAAVGAVDRGGDGSVSLVSAASVERLGAAAGMPGLDARRLRMLVEIDGVEAHEEDAWIGRRLRLGGAVVTMLGHVGRCLVTKLDPDTGEPDVDTLGALGSYRREADTSEPLACGVHGSVIEPGVVRIGDEVEPL